MSQSYEAASLALHHIVIRPAKRNSGSNPCVVMLHGRGSNEEDLVSLAHELGEDLFYISVRAPFELGFGYHWYEFISVGTPEKTTFMRSIGLLREFLTQLPQSYPINPSKIYLLGFSQGAVMAGSILLQEPSVAAGAIMLSGYVVTPGNDIGDSSLANKHCFVAHGLYDDVIPVDLGRQASIVLKEHGADVTYKEYPIAHYVSDEEVADLKSWIARNLNASFSD